MDAGTVKTPGHIQGGSSPGHFHPLDDLVCISGEDLRRAPLSLNSVHDRTPPQDSYKAWVEMLVRNLSPEGQQIVACWQFNLLEQVYNCGAAHTQLFGAQVDHTRRDHCIHAAHSVQGLNTRADLDLSVYELKVLELVMLLHDPHRLGSHALDHVFASIPGAPPIKEWGWSKDFHEYHGAKLVAKDSDIKEVLGGYWADVFAVLALPDTRHRLDATRIKDYGNIEPTLPHDRLHLLHRLKDEVDRNSYLILDYVRSGIDDRITTKVITAIERYEKALTISSNGALCVVLPANVGDQQSYPFDDLISARNLFREHVATHPVSSLVDIVLRQAVWKTIQEKFGDRMESRGCYDFVRNIALEGSYHKLFGQPVLDLLAAPRSMNSSLGLEDTYAPLITLTLKDLSERSGSTTVTTCIPPQLSREMCGAPRSDMTLLEYRVRDALRKAGIDCDVSLVLSNDFEKIFQFQVSSSAANPIEVNRLGVRASMETIKVIVAAKALDDEGRCIDLKPAQDAVKAFLSGSKLLRNPECLTQYNPRAFCEPFEPELFNPEVRARMERLEPAWITRGGCGLV